MIWAGFGRVSEWLDFVSAGLDLLFLPARPRFFSLISKMTSVIKDSQKAAIIKSLTSPANNPLSGQYILAVNPPTKTIGKGEILKSFHSMVLSRVARFVLAIPCSAAGSESDFSISGLLLGDKRSQAKPDRVNSQIVMRSNMDLVRGAQLEEKMVLDDVTQEEGCDFIFEDDDEADLGDLVGMVEAISMDAFYPAAEY